MKARVLLTAAVLVPVSGTALAACPGTTQVVNQYLTASVTFASGLSGNASVGGAAATWTGSKTGTQVAEAFDSTSSGSTPVSTAGFAFSTGYNGWNAGDNGDTASVVFTRNGATGDLVCSGTPGCTVTAGTINNALTNLLSGNTVCESAGGGNWKHQEYHQAGGAVIDWKRGPGHPVDPTATVGSWSVSGTGSNTTVTYTYGSTPYVFKVWDNGGGSYSFCQGTAETLVTIKSGQGACP